MQEARERVLADAQCAGLPADNRALNDLGLGANAYADAVATCLGIAIDRLADRNSTVCSWDTGYVKVRNTFARQAIPMVWDFAEANPFSSSSGNFLGAIEWIAEVIEASPCNKIGDAQLGIVIGEEAGSEQADSNEVYQYDATVSVNGTTPAMYSTDPPYYDNVGYADLSDFFYIWLRRTLGPIYPDLFSEPLTDKKNELIASPYRFGGNKELARAFFEEKLRKVFEAIYQHQHNDYPFTLYYAFKQAELREQEEGDRKRSKKSGAATGWETMLESLIQVGFTITGTWPISTEMAHRSVGQGANALTSSIAFVCRKRLPTAPVASRRQFLNELRAELPDAVRRLQQGGIAPVDVAQASIGPGMAIYWRYSKVVESDGTPLSVRTALKLINQTLDEVLAEQEGEYDTQTRWAIAWFAEYAHNQGEYGRAETLSKAKNISLQSLVDAGLLVSRGGKVRLRRRDELSEVWQPSSGHLTVWEVMQRMIAALHKDGDEGAGKILRQVSEQGELAHDLAYRLYKLCDSKGWSEEALAYNNLITSWSEINRFARREASDKGLWEATFLG